MESVPKIAAGENARLFRLPNYRAQFLRCTDTDVVYTTGLGDRPQYNLEVSLTFTEDNQWLRGFLLQVQVS